MVTHTSEATDLAEEISRMAKATQRSVGAAESLTGGALSSALASAPDAGDWYVGAVVAYRSATKYRVLGVKHGPVITAECAIEMARGVRSLLAADLSITLTGVGGPDPQEGQPPGTVYIAVASEHGERAFPHRLHGSPDQVVALTVVEALRHLRDELANQTP